MKGIATFFGGLGLLISAAWANGDDLTSCGADALTGLVGRKVEEVRDRLPPEARVLAPNSPMTQDHRPDRVNVALDDDGVIVRFWCG
ncbi:I78 family peptidase inhibitor [Jhaorihella thermophila]|uniref:Peptidase inhibitor I78 family protein n=1 Tax=Jhaorihella thermophila TaxID=488547 RepID=A0A1H5T972_9RHOB|nr:I78 family peptidase inhibitor [Jhaorihella thermophila]SEF58537.1 Peptidase inhibitor I78 family protein [Jhaorihella thermophila]